MQSSFFRKFCFQTVTQWYTSAIFLSTGLFLSRAVIYVRDVAWVGGGYRHMYALHTEGKRGGKTIAGKTDVTYS